MLVMSSFYATKCSFNENKYEYNVCIRKCGSFISDLLVDGKQFGGAGILWDGFSHRVIAKRLQRASDVESLVDHLM